MKLGFSQAEEEFRAECAAWLQSQLNGDFADIKGLPGMNSMIERRKDWEQRLRQGTSSFSRDCSTTLARELGRANTSRAPPTGSRKSPR